METNNISCLYGNTRIPARITKITTLIVSITFLSKTVDIKFWFANEDVNKTFGVCNYFVVEKTFNKDVLYIMLLICIIIRITGI